MTWSQMEYFVRAASWLDADRALLELAMIHNPYTQQNRIGRLGRVLRRRMRSDEFGTDDFGMGIDSRDGGRVGMTGESLSRVASVFGPVKKVILSPEEFAKRMRARE